MLQVNEAKDEEKRKIDFSRTIINKYLLIRLNQIKSNLILFDQYWLDILCIFRTLFIEIVSVQRLKMIFDQRNVSTAQSVSNRVNLDIRGNRFTARSITSQTRRKLTGHVPIAEMILLRSPTWVEPAWIGSFRKSFVPPFCESESCRKKNWSSYADIVGHLCNDRHFA